MKKNIYKYTLFIILMVLLSTTNVFAASGTGGDCVKGVLGNPDTTGTIAYYLQQIFEILRYIAIALAIVLTIVDLGKALLDEGKDQYKTIMSKGIKRFLWAAAIFFLPNILNALLKLIGLYGTCGIG